jgi:hypothetical protein
MIHFPPNLLPFFRLFMYVKYAGNINENKTKQKMASLKIRNVNASIIRSSFVNNAGTPLHVFHGKLVMDSSIIANNQYGSLGSFDYVRPS